MANSNMWKCEHCGAPNPQARSTCYSCQSTRQDPSPFAGSAVPDPLEGTASPLSESVQPSVQASAPEVPASPQCLCRFCGGEVPLNARKCMHCGEWLKVDKSGQAARTVLYLLVAIGGFLAVFLITTRLYYGW